MAERDAPAQKPPTTWFSLARLMAKALVLAALLNLAFAPSGVMDALARLSLYNRVFPGRLRFPFGDDPERSYNVSVTRLEALFASHELDGSPREDEDLRVFILGDSSVWGFRLGSSETLAAQLNALDLEAEGRRLTFHNLGYPTMSLLKDLLILDRGLAYQPDVIVWLVTLESFPEARQAEAPLVSFNRDAAQALLRRFGVDPERYFDPAPAGPWWQAGWVAQRQEVAELFRLQVYGLMWAASGVDHDLSAVFEPRAEDLEADPGFQSFTAGDMTSADLAWDLLRTGAGAAGEVPVLIVNEPMFVSAGAHSDVRYNFFYPRWAYDDYRAWFDQECRRQAWRCIDLWNELPAEVFTDSAVHYNAAGAAALARILAEPILELAGETTSAP